jgi:hypothetical protein
VITPEEIRARKEVFSRQRAALLVQVQKLDVDIAALDEVLQEMGQAQ